MKFSDIPGQENAKKRLRSMVDSDHIPHAIMLQGPEGAGKYSLARAFAQYVHCQNRTPQGDSCGKCPACLQHSSLNHIDTIFSYPVVKTGSGKPTISDDFMPEFREMLQESPFMDFEVWRSKLDKKDAQPKIFVDEAAELSRKLRYTSHRSKYKIVLMWQAHRMNEEAANKLLKMLEEPEEGTIFVLTTDTPSLILPTIYSRMQRINVNRATDDDIIQFLMGQYPIDDSAAASIANLAEGSYNKALQLIAAQGENDSKFLDLFTTLMRVAYQRKIADLKIWSEKIAAMGRERQMQFYEYCCRMIRENFILNLHNPALVKMTTDENNFSLRFSPYINERNVEFMMKTFNNARNDIAANCNAKIVNFDVAVKIILLLKQ